MKFLKKQLLIIGLVIVAIVFLPSTILLLLGMLPTIVVSLSDRTAQRLKTVTIGCLNFASCFPFWIDLALGGHSVEQALHMVGQPATIIVMYMGAGAGYGLELFLTQMVANFSAQQGRNRLKNIQAKQKVLITRWGPEVAGDLPLDSAGFPMTHDKTNAI